MNPPYTISQAKQKLEHFCAYQERCHEEVNRKLRDYGMYTSEIDEVIVHLITSNFLNEERFACSFARGKHRIKQWGKVRISKELKFKKIAQINITTALKEISEEEYLVTFHKLAERNWENSTDTIAIKKRKKQCDFLLRKGFESNLVYEKIKDLESNFRS